VDITVALSFSSQANFTRAFRQGTGMTPGQYRRSFTHARLSGADPVERTAEASPRREAFFGVLRAMSAIKE